MSENAPKPHDCSVSRPAQWTAVKLRWCCENEKLGCEDAAHRRGEVSHRIGGLLGNKEVEKTYDCDGGQFSDWAVARQDWCCRQLVSLGRTCTDEVLTKIALMLGDSKPRLHASTAHLPDISDGFEEAGQKPRTSLDDRFGGVFRVGAQSVLFICVIISVSVALALRTRRQRPDIDLARQVMTGANWLERDSSGLLMDIA